MPKNKKKPAGQNANTIPLGNPKKVLAEPKKQASSPSPPPIVAKAKAKKPTPVTRYGHLGATIMAAPAALAESPSYSVGAINDDVITFMPDVADLEALKVKVVKAETVFPVSFVATSVEMKNRLCVTTGKAKCIGVGIKPTTSGFTGTFVGIKRTSVTVTNITDMPISVTATAPRNWSLTAAITDTYIAFPARSIPPGGKAVFNVPNEYDPVFYPASTTPALEAKYELLKMVVYAGNAWSESYRVSTAAAGVVTMVMKNVEAFKITTEVEFMTTGASPTEDEKQRMICLAYSYDFSYLEYMNGTTLMPPMPDTRKGAYSVAVQSSNNTKRTLRYSGALPTYSAGSNIDIQTMQVNLVPCGGKGLCLSTQNYTDTAFGLGAYVYIGIVDENYKKGRVTPWRLQGATINGVSQEDNLMAHSIEVPGSCARLIFDELLDDSVVSAGTFRWWSEKESFVMWDYVRNEPVLVGQDYDASYGLYVRPAFAPAMTALKTIVGQNVVSQPDATADGVTVLPNSAGPPYTITWAAAENSRVVLIEVVQVSRSVFDEYERKEKASMHMVEPAKERARFQAIKDASLKRLMRDAADVKKTVPPKVPSRLMKK